MQIKKTNRLGIYSIFIFIWIIIVTVLSFFFISIFLDRFKENIIALINENIPVNIAAQSIKYKLPLKLEFVDVVVSSKESKDEFLDIKDIKLTVNLFKLISQRNFFSSITYVEIVDTWVYPASFDYSILRSGKNKKTNTSEEDFLTSLKNMLHSLSEKSIVVKNINIGTSKQSAVTLGIKIQNLDATLNETGYNFYFKSVLPDSTSFIIKADTSTNLSKFSATASAKDKNGILFIYDAKISSDNSILNASVKDIYNKSVFDIRYDIKDDRTYFSIENANVQQFAVEKILDMILSVKVTSKEESILRVFGNENKNVLENVKKSMTDFVSASFSANGSYKKGSPLYLHFNADAITKGFNFLLNLTLTNNVVSIDDSVIFIDKSKIEVNAKLPVKNLYKSEAQISVYDFNIGNEQLNAKANIISVYDNENYASSKFAIRDISYGSKTLENITYTLLYNKRDNMLRAASISDLDKAFFLDVYMNKNAVEIASGQGYIPVDVLIIFLGNKIIDPLSSIYVSYNAKKIDGKLTHHINVNSKTIYTMEDIINAEIAFDKDNITVNNLYYRASRGISITATGRMYRNSKNSWKMNTSITTPLGLYEADASFIKEKNITRIYASAISNSIIAKGFIISDGTIDINVNTEKEIDIEYFRVGVNAGIKKNPEDEKISVKGDLSAMALQNAIEFNVKSNFELTDGGVVFDNIYYENRGYIMNGKASLKNENSVNAIELELIERNDGGGVVAVNAKLNKDNIFATIGISKLPLSSFLTKAGMDGDLYMMATIIGDTKNPAVLVDQFSLLNFDISAYRFDISFSGNYSGGIIDAKNIVIKKIGADGTYLIKDERITIPRLFFSENKQFFTAKIKNFYLMSNFNGDIEYTMDIDEYNRKNYNLHMSSLKINKKKWPTFSTWAVEDEKKILLSSMTSHGINGSVTKIDGSLLLDLYYILGNVEKIEAYGNIKGGALDVNVTSKNLGIEIFEFFAVLFKEIKGTPDTFEKDGERYTLFANIVGDIKNLMVYGRFKGKGIVKTTYFSDVFDETDVDFTFAGNILKINKLSILTKKQKSGIEMTGDANFIGNTLENMDFNLKTVGEEFNVFLLPDKGSGFLDANADIKILKVRGLTKLDLDIYGNIKEPTIAGDISLEKNDIQLTIGGKNRYETKVNNIMNNTMWKLTIHAISRVQVNYSLLGEAYVEDGSELRVDNTIARGIELDGNINIKKGTIYYIQNAYAIEEGNILFIQLDSLDPIINVRAFTKRRYVETGNPFDITLYMEIVNTRASSLINTIATPESPIRFYTVPALDTYKVNELAGVYSTILDTQTRDTDVIGSREIQFTEQAERIFVSYGDLLLRNTVLRPIERWFRKFFGIDYVTVDTALINELFFNDPAPGENKTLKSYFDNTKVSFGKYVTRDLFVRYGVTYEKTPSILSTKQNVYHFNQEFGFEVTLLRDLRLANLLFEYKIHPFEIQKQQEFNITTRWRF